MANDSKMDTPLSLDTTLDDIEDLPGFTQFPSGAYIVTAKEGFAEKEINDTPAIQLEMVLNSVQELPPDNLNKDEEPPKPGDICTVSWMLDNKVGVGMMKEVMAPTAKLINPENPKKVSIRQVMEVSKGMQYLVIINRRHNKEKDRDYSSIKVLQPV